MIEVIKWEKTAERKQVQKDGHHKVKLTEEHLKKLQITIEQYYAKIWSVYYRC